VAVAAPNTVRAAESTTPPRVDGPYFGVTATGTTSFVRVNDLETPRPFRGFGGSARVGQAVLPWMTIGLLLEGTLAYSSHDDARQRVGQGSLGVEFGFLPVPRTPLSLRAGFGIGGGAVREDGVRGRSGFGGPVFTGAIRYELFPWADRRRPRRGGGFSLGPEIGWIGATPAASGRPMSNTVYAGLAMLFYLGS
jgi:hypothetical protein